MREIKFRALLKDPFTNETTVVHPDWIDFGGKVCGGASYKDNEWEANYIKLMQYTGLNDDKGNDIFEGDLLSNSENNNIFEVIFKDGCFMVKHKNIIICPLKTVVKNGCEVIGVISEIEKGLSKN